MNKPYYETELGQLYCGDCLEIMKEMDDKSVDLVLTDPPYNVGLDYCDGDRRIDYKEWCVKWFNLLPEPILLTCGMKNIGMWYEITKPKWMISWVKPNQNSPSALGGFNAWEPILVYGKLNKRLGQDIFIKSIGLQKSIGNHPCPKFLPFWRLLLSKTTERNNCVLDPFLGSGTTALACEQLGRRWIGIEISEKYCEIAKQRIKAEADQEKML